MYKMLGVGAWRRAFAAFRADVPGLQTKDRKMQNGRIYKIHRHTRLRHAMVHARDSRETRSFSPVSMPTRWHQPT